MLPVYDRSDDDDESKVAGLWSHLSRREINGNPNDFFHHPYHQSTIIQLHKYFENFNKRILTKLYITKQWLAYVKYSSLIDH